MLLSAKSFVRCFGFVLIAAIVVAVPESCCAQTEVTTDTGAGGAATGGTAIGGEPDLSAFDSIDRGASVGGASTEGFGLGGGAAAGGAGGGGGFGGGGGGFGGLGGLFGGLGGAFGGQNAGSTKPIIRVRLRSAIKVAPRPTFHVQQSANQALNRVPASSGIRNVSVNMNGGTAVLTGTVQTDRDRRMSELLLRLEPGVRNIDNRVQVNQ